ncbi:hypothetical protein GIB67_033886 [Kingdonia uniflora]|uniref:Uncharacterized protein n=1 Tax=Kingdonia uniflora TaxID=39325 RepID=A0A7J7MJ19_9MAGN|nr:hypothetical protein GIB67_033886 [Kingdonia uniflora]
MISSCVKYTCTCSSIRRLSLNIKSLMYRVESGGPVDSWDCWNSFRVLCEHHS